MKLEATRFFPAVPAATAALCLLLAGAPARADDGGSAAPGVARISDLTGNVDVRRADSGETFAASLNAPVAAGDQLGTGDGARAEIELSYGALVRVAPDTQIRFTRLDGRRACVQLARGTVELSLPDAPGARPEIDTPAVTVVPGEGGRYRITVGNDGSTEVTARSGLADAIAPDDAEIALPGSTLLVAGQGAAARFTAVAAEEDDDFDRWSDSRDTQFDDGDAGSPGAAYAGDGMLGADALDQYGTWTDVASYGDVWVPTDQPAGWAPYRYGRWLWAPYYGWTWIGSERWGWAPYHYGRWFYASGRGWCWAPGARTGIVYQPGLVTFLSFGELPGGIIGWLPLAPNEPLHPWWGAAYRSHGAAVVDSVTIDEYRTDISKRYRNALAPSATSTISGSDFRAGNFERVRAATAPQLARVAPVTGILPIVPPTGASFQNERRAVENAVRLSYPYPAHAVQVIDGSAPHGPYAIPVERESTPGSAASDRVVRSTQWAHAGSLEYTPVAEPLATHGASVDTSVSAARSYPLYVRSTGLQQEGVRALPAREDFLQHEVGEPVPGRR